MYVVVFPTPVTPKGDHMLDDHRFLLIKEFQPINKKEMIKLEY